MPLVSIITPTHRAPSKSKMIALRCFDSVDRQTHSNWEHLVVADGDDEHVKNLIEKQNNPKRKYFAIEHQGNYGNAARRAALDKATGKYLIFLDDDNIIFPTYLEKMINALVGAGDEKFAICEILHFGPVQSFLGAPPIVLKGDPKMFYIDTLQVMLDREAFMTVGWLGNDYYADGRTYEEMGKRHKFVRVPEVLCVHL